MNGPQLWTTGGQPWAALWTMTIGPPPLTLRRPPDHQRPQRTPTGIVHLGVTCGQPAVMPSPSREAEVHAHGARGAPRRPPFGHHSPDHGQAWRARATARPAGRARHGRGPPPGNLRKECPGSRTRERGRTLPEPRQRLSTRASRYCRPRPDSNIEGIDRIREYPGTARSRTSVVFSLRGAGSTIT